MTHDDLNAAIRLSLLLSDSKPERHNVYRLRARRQERETAAVLYPARTRVDNVVPIRPFQPEPPRAA